MNGEAIRAATVFIVIPVHDRVAHTRACLRSLCEQTWTGHVEIVVDDGSTDGTDEMVRHEFAHAVLLRGNGALWWAGATNLGARWALRHAQEDDFILMHNDDTIVKADYLESLLADAARYPRALIGATAVQAPEGDLVVDGGVRIDWRTARTQRLAHRKLLSRLRVEEPDMVPVDALAGRGMLVPVAVFREVGLLAADVLPQYGADWEFSCRAARAGYRLYVSRRAVVQADVTATGLHAGMRHLSPMDTVRSLWNRRSPTSLPQRWRFAMLTVPRQHLASYLLCDTARVVGGRLRDVIAWVADAARRQAH